MIKKDELIEIGVFNKPHGICGEINATIDIDIDLSDLKCIVLNIDGIFVPFFIQSVRPKGSDTFLLTIDGIDNENDALQLSRKEIYALKIDCDIVDDSENDEEGMYAEDFIGYTIIDEKNIIGKITAIEDSTENILFIVTTPNDNEIYIPVASEFITAIDTESHTLHMNLPLGLSSL